MNNGRVENRFRSHLLRKGLSQAYVDWLVQDYSFIVRKCGTPSPSVGDIEDVYDTLLAKKVSATRLSNFLKTVRHYCEFAGIERPDIKAPRNFNQRVTYLTDFEAGRLLDACDSIRDYAVLCVMLYGGLRRKEVAEIQLCDLKMGERVLTVHGSKTHTEADCILHKDAVEAIAQWLRRRPEVSHNYLFTSQGGGPLTPSNVGKIVSKYSKKAHILKHVTCHVLRHTLATNLILNGADVTLVQKQLRHRSIQSTLIYTHITTEKQKELYDRFIPQF